MTAKLFSALNEKMPALNVMYDEPLARHSSFRIGGAVSALAMPQTESELISLLSLLREFDVSPLVLGRGSNILAVDAPIERFVIKLGTQFGDISQLSETGIVASSGASLAKIAVFARNLGLTGFEFAHGIPGSLGGAIYMNAGAYGGEMCDCVRSVRYFDMDSFEVREKCVAELNFAYRHSFFCDKNHIILSATIELSHGDVSEIEATMQTLAQKRRESQPLEHPSGGSTFKRPQTGYAAAMIDECGLKGYCVGGAMVSPKHAGFVVSDGTASFADVMAVMEHVSETVFREKGVLLEAELRIIR